MRKLGGGVYGYSKRVNRVERRCMSIKRRGGYGKCNLGASSYLCIDLPIHATKPTDKPSPGASLRLRDTVRGVVRAPNV